MSYNLNYSLLVLISVLFIADLIFQLYKKRNVLEFIPSTIWFILCSLPILLLAKDFQSEIVSIQLLGIGIFQVALWGSDRFPIQNLGGNQSANLEKFPTWILGSLCIAIWIYHLYEMPEVPLFAKYFKGIDDPLELALLREQSSKLLKLPFGMIYIVQSTLTFFAPVTLVFFIQQKKWISSVVFFVLALIYSRATLAKGPIFLFLAVTGTLLFFSWIRYAPWYPRLKKYSLIAASIVLLYSAQFLMLNEKSIFNLTPPAEIIQQAESQFTDIQKSPLKLSRVDYYRILKAEEIYEGMNILERNINFYAYRALFVPVEVSYYWYFYFSQVSEKLGAYGLLPGTRNADNFEHPATRVGQWAFTHRFPDQYAETIRAYCSVDADAYARFGYIGLLLIAASLIALRLFLKWIKVQSKIGDSLYYATLVIAGIYLPVSSLFSLAISSGISFYVLLQIIIKTSNMKNKTAE